MSFENNWTKWGSEAIFEHWGKALLSLTFVHLLWTIIWRRWLSPLSKFPGPFWGSVTDLYSVYINLYSQQHLAHYELHKKYGPIVRYRPNLLIVSDPKALPVIYHRYSDKTDFYTQLVGANTSFVALKHEDHAIARRRIAGPYSSTVVRQLEGRMDTWIRDWTHKLRDEFSKTGKLLNFNNQVLWLAYDMVADITFGKPFGFVAAGSDVNGIITGAKSTLFIHRAVNLVPGLLWWLRNTRFGRSLLPKRSDDFGYGFVMAEAKRLALSDEVNSAGNKTFLRMFLEAKGPDGSSMTIEQMASEARAILVGGGEPIASITIGFLLNVLENPACYERLTAEISEAECKGLLSNPVATYEEAQSLVYFNACLCETLRGAEATTTMVPRLAKKGGTVVLGHFVPEGAHLSATPWITGRDFAMYGEDAELFRPERWLEASSEQLQMWRKYNFQFGYSTRACAGKEIGLMGVYKLSLQVARNFKVKRLNEPCPERDSFTRKMNDRTGRDLGLFVEKLREREGVVN